MRYQVRGSKSLGAGGLLAGPGVAREFPLILEERVKTNPTHTRPFPNLSARRTARCSDWCSRRDARQRANLGRPMPATDYAIRKSGEP